jgi:pyrroloquinoline quinone biosynthesis protein B
MRIRLLGTAAGGGVPQWNCNCKICREARAGGGRVQNRTQSSVAISADGQRWFLLNASPDLRSQIEAFPELNPPQGGIRGSPIEGTLLTNADLDHVLGLLLMREGAKLVVHAPPAICASTRLCTAILDHFCGIRWVNPPPVLAPLLCRDSSESGLLYRMIPLGGKAPRFEVRNCEHDDHVVGYHFIDQKTRGRLLCLPNVPRLDDSIKTLLSDCDVLLFDGTFWNEDELIQLRIGSEGASEMGHVPIGGPSGTLAVLKMIDVKHKIYIHLNNTNPVLLEGSEEEKAVLAAGCVPGTDGLELVI